MQEHKPSAAQPTRRRLRIASQERDKLGEGPVWDERSGQLLRVDIARGKVLAMEPPDRTTGTIMFGADLSAVVLRERGGLVLAVGHEIVALDAGGARETLAIVEDHKPDNRFNDCRCDARGRLWAGTMSTSQTRGAAALYCLVPGAPIRVVVPNTTISNGIGWSPDGQRMYFVDGTTRRIDTLDFDADIGQVTNRRAFAEIAPSDGVPGGIAVDREGGVWVCLFGGGAVRRYRANGQIDEHISLPVTNPTCPAFGGPALNTLYITTARHRLSFDQLDREPLAGALLALDVGVSGLPTNRFAG